MLHNHHRDLSIGSYLLIGFQIFGVELLGLSTTLKLTLCMVGAGLAISLMAAAIHHRRSSRQRQKEGSDWARRLRLAMSPPERVGPSDERYLNAHST